MAVLKDIEKGKTVRLEADRCEDESRWPLYTVEGPPDERESLVPLTDLEGRRVWGHPEADTQLMRLVDRDGAPGWAPDMGGV